MQNYCFSEKNCLYYRHKPVERPLTGLRPNKCVTNNKEYTMKKQGFTLIELMVVIVIMGILAAVAVPKLFGMIAKSKASEVGPAAGTYVKMQQAYISEAAAVGNWKIIGYVGPGTTKTATNTNGTGGAVTNTTNFEYSEGTGYVANTAAAASGFTGFSVKNVIVLNDCTSAAGNWTVSTTASVGDTDATFNAVVATDCKALTPQFEQIGK